MTGLAPRRPHIRLWATVAAAVGCAIAAIAVLRLDPEPSEAPARQDPPPPASPPIAEPTPVPIDVGDPIDATVTTPPAPAASAPPPALPQEPWQSIVLADGRSFIGTYEQAQGTIRVRAAVRGGTLLRMQPIVIRVTEREITSLKPYDGRLGAVSGTYVPAPDPQREEDIAQQRQSAALLAEQRRQEAAERERRRKLALQRDQAAKQIGTIEVAQREATRREQEITAGADRLDEDRRLKLELANALQLQLNTAKDRWNQEVQTLGPRVRRPDGTWGGGPTEATETLVNSLQEQIRSARQGAAAAEQRKAGEAAERQQLLARLAQLDADLVSARSALAALSDPP